MGLQMNVSEAKAKLSELIEACEAGREVVIARAGKPCVRLVAVSPPTKRKLGFVELDIPDDFFEPLSGDELALWE